VSSSLQTVKTDEIDRRLQTSPIVAVAARLTRHLLDAVPDRLTHSQAVAARAEFFTLTVAPEDADLLVAAAWLHDIGYAPDLRDTGFHPLDGARHLHNIGWPPAICNLVAHHSGARYVAQALNLGRELYAYPFSASAVSDALTVADQTTGLRGEPVTVEGRMRDMLKRHGPHSANARAHPQRERYIRAAASRVANRLDSCGVDRAHQYIIGTG
jgi:putative nucleotidyltransferase with HDIG domain